MEKPWKVTFLISRQKGQEAPHFESFVLDVNPDEYLLDAVERVWAFHDRSLCFAHACHHSTCGACGMRVNGVEKLTCITPIKSVTSNGGTVRVEPLRNFPVVSDLAVDMGSLYQKMEQVGHHSVNLIVAEPVIMKLPVGEVRASSAGFTRLSDCIECGLCISACPAAATNPDYLGPAPLAGAHQHRVRHKEDKDIRLMQLVDSDVGLWRCHSAYECTAVCPSNVDPAERIMSLRRQVLSARIRSWFGR
jgi:succinate dehydrogenase/fumarate reductase iron-sulfur protein